MKYWLRRVIFEDTWEQQLEELIALCRRAEIDGVLLMEESHMVMMSPYPIQKHEKMAKIYRKMGERFAEEKIHYGVNIASLVGHTDMKVPAEYCLDIQKYVGDDLQEAHACYCILDKKWQEYATEVCGLYASTKPEMLFIDDDFRSLNHGRTLGCFCPLHVRETRKRLGNLWNPEKTFTAQDILKALQEDSAQALAIRTAWMEANGEGQKEAVRRIRECVQKENPDVMLGLMSSDEMRHSLQGRKIGELLKELAGETKKMLYRPTGAIYGDAIHGAVFEGHQRMALTMGEVDGKLHTVSELELFPHSRFGCSRRMSELLLKLQILAGADDISLNLYDYLGNPVEREPIWEAMLKENKEFLIFLSEMRKGKKLRGFGLPYRQDESRYRTYDGYHVQKLYANRILDILFPRMGIPVQFTEGSGNAIVGEAIWCYGDEEIEKFLSKGFFTDARGAAVLEKRGFGKYLGCHVRQADSTIPALERLLPTSYAGEFSGDLMPCRWYLYEEKERYVLKPFEDAEVLTELLDLEKQAIGAGTVLYHNRLGGKCVVMALSPSEETWCFRQRAWLIGQLAAELSGGELPLFIPDCPDLGPIYYENEANGNGLLAVLNGSLDSYNYKLTEQRICLRKKIYGEGTEKRLKGMSMEIWETNRL